MADSYECLRLDGIIYPPSCVHPPELYKYPKPKLPIQLLFLGWNPPKPYGGFWSLEFDDSLRSDLHRILKTLGKIETSSPGQIFMDEFLERGFYFIHTVKCWTEAKFPGFGRDAQSKEGRERKVQIGLPMLYACVKTHLADELKTLSPQKVCALGGLSFLGLCDLYPKLSEKPTTPTQGHIFPKGSGGLPWPLLYSCFPQGNSVPIKGTKQRKKAWKVVCDHLGTFL